MRGWTSGLAVPHFVIDAPGRGGKIPLCPDSVQEITAEKVVLRNYAGGEYLYPLPKEEEPVCFEASGEGTVIPPAAAARVAGAARPNGGNGNGTRRNGNGKPRNGNKAESQPGKPLPVLDSGVQMNRTSIIPEPSDT